MHACMHDLPALPRMPNWQQLLAAYWVVTQERRSQAGHREERLKRRVGVAGVAHIAQACVRLAILQRGKPHACVCVCASLQLAQQTYWPFVCNPVRGRFPCGSSPMQGHASLRRSGTAFGIGMQPHACSRAVTLTLSIVSGHA